MQELLFETFFLKMRILHEISKKREKRDFGYRSTFKALRTRTMNRRLNM